MYRTPASRAAATPFRPRGRHPAGRADRCAAGAGGEAARRRGDGRLGEGRGGVG